MKEKQKKTSSKKMEWLKRGIGGLLLLIFVSLALGPIIGQFTKKDNYGQVLNYGVFGNFVVLTDSMEPEYKKGTALVTKKDSAEKLYSLYLENEKKNEELNKEYYAKLKEASNNFSPMTSDSKMMEQIVSLLDEYESKSAHFDLTFIDGYQNYGSVRLKNKETDPILAFLNNPIQLTGEDASSRVMTHRLREIQYQENVPYGQGRYLFVVSGINIGGNQSGLGQYQVFSEKELLGKVELQSQFLGGFFKFVASPWGLVILLLIPSGYLMIVSIRDILKALNEKDEEEQTTKTDNPPKNPVAGRVELDGMSKEEKERLKAELLEEMLEEKTKKK